ncbi:MAG: terminase small subunit [Zoogloeaceae bacterium]|nr:terminase small subunit [Zoogloeaceae bacterium]MCK6385241.1 terminase small subunit [Rhodocyclaceae bacterium]
MLTPRQAKFVEAYALDRNAARAARKAGYSPNGAKVTACRLLTNPNLQAALAAKKSELARKMDLSKEQVIAELRAAVEEARRLGKPGEMIRGWVEIAKMAGLYEPEKVRVVLGAEGERLRAKFEALSDEELMKIAAGC